MAFEFSSGLHRLYELDSAADTSILKSKYRVEVSRCTSRRRFIAFRRPFPKWSNQQRSADPARSRFADPGLEPGRLLPPPRYLLQSELHFYPVGQWAGPTFLASGMDGRCSRFPVGALGDGYYPNAAANRSHRGRRD